MKFQAHLLALPSLVFSLIKLFLALEESADISSFFSLCSMIREERFTTHHLSHTPARTLCLNMASTLGILG